MENTDTVIKGMRDKTFYELSDEEKEAFPAIFEKLYLSLDEENIIFLSFMFNSTVFEALSKVR